MASATLSGVESPIEEVMRALTDRQSEMEIRLDGIELRLPYVREPVSLRGTVTVRLHMQETPPSGPRNRRRA